MEPFNLHALYNRAVCYEKLGQHSEAQRDLQRVNRYI